MLRDGGVELQQPSATSSVPGPKQSSSKGQPPPIILAVDELHCVACDLSAGGGALDAALQEVRPVRAVQL